ncbi:FtsQ-type POTRA domain-containing protein [Nicoliella spurrieriana]|uniref:Cell division protein DivIB n=1 Tax=Nicoliella spurrieriana TaxID=2925830 RepID=A0A976RRS9_9LACO|nr:cell division protein FtsQ/DivIB [Nicoliella spurrieriana]UQS86436.1 FtsQ-type POTRA domain-containing protein [Nicoliella spurrieriana]
MARIGKNNQKNTTEQTPWEQYQNRYQKNEKVKNRFFGNRFNFQWKLKLNAAFMRFSIVMGLLVLMLISLIYLVSPLSRVSQKSITGNHKLQTDEIITSIPIKNGDSIIHILNHRQQIISKFLKSNPQVKSASFDVNHLNRVKFTIVEYGTAGYLYSQDKYYIVLDNGEIINKYILTPSSSLPIFVNFKPNNNLKMMTVQYSKLSKTVKQNIIKIEKAPTSYDPQRIKLTMHDKNIVYARSDTLASKMSYYPSIVSKIKKPSIINLEVGAYSYPIKYKK